MDVVILGWSRMSEGERGAFGVASILAEPAEARARGEDVPSGADFAAACISRMCAPALDELLAVGVTPGDVASRHSGCSLLKVALVELQMPYP